MSQPSGLDDQVRDDVLAMVGGNFTPISFGPERYKEIVERARSRPKDYLEVFESLFLGANFDALRLSHLSVPYFLEFLSPVDPVAVRATAQRVLKQYDAVLVIYDAATDKNALFGILPEETVRLFQRLDGHRIELRQLLKEE